MSKHVSEAGRDSETAAKDKHLSVVDRRRVGHGLDEHATEPNLKPTYVQELEARTARAEDTLKLRLTQLEEETARARTRIQGDLEQRFSRKERDILLEVLDFMEDARRAAELTADSPAVAQGLEVVTARVDNFLKLHGCERLSPQGEPFDPERMEAVAMVEGPAGTVVGVFRPGYTRGGELLKPAQVTVGKG